MAVKQPVAAGAIKTVAKSSTSAAPPGAKQVPLASTGTAVAAARGRAGSGGSGVASGGSAPGAAAAVVGTGIPAGTSPAHGKDAELTLKFSADSWAEVYDAAGQRLFYDVGAAASAHTMKGPAPLRVVLGNAAGVAVEINGHPTAIPSSVLPDGGTQFSINARGRAVRAKPADGG
jgi:cytoskeleton protein RodZ